MSLNKCALKCVLSKQRSYMTMRNVFKLIGVCAVCSSSGVYVFPLKTTISVWKMVYVNGVARAYAIEFKWTCKQVKRMNGEQRKRCR